MLPYWQGATPAHLHFVITFVNYDGTCRWGVISWRLLVQCAEGHLQAGSCRNTDGGTWQGEDDLVSRAGVQGEGGCTAPHRSHCSGAASFAPAWLWGDTGAYTMYRWDVIGRLSSSTWYVYWAGCCLIYTWSLSQLNFTFLHTDIFPISVTSVEAGRTKTGGNIILNVRDLKNNLCRAQSDSDHSWGL